MVAAAVALAAACSGGADAGEPCSDSADCRAELQCLAGVCTPRCDTHRDCGDGYLCEAGECQQVFSEIGDPCQRELDCGPGQTCRLDPTDESGDGTLSATCQPDQLGAPTGAPCGGDDDCRNGICSLGRCTEVCAEGADCPGQMACVLMPRLLPDGSPLFRGCLQARGTLALDIPVSSTHETTRVPVPSNARSFGLVTRIDDTNQLAGVSEVIDPVGRVLYATPHSPEEFYQNPLRYAPAAEISTLMVPNTPTIEVEPGAYRVSLGSFTRAGGNGTEVPEVTVLYKLDGATGLDLNFYFLNLEDHPCPVFGDTEMSCSTTKISGAEAAQQSPLFQNVYLQGGLAPIFETAGLYIDEVTYTDICDRPDLDGLDSSELARLLRLSEHDRGINIFFVRSIHPPGLQALVGGTPGPPGIPGTSASGIAVSADTLCYRDWQTVARLTAHEIGRHLGLFRNREPDGAMDPIPDSDDSSGNLMFFSEFGGTELSDGQKAVLRGYPGLR